MIDLETILLSGVCTLIFAGIGSYVMWKIAGPRVVVKAIQTQMGPILLEWLTTPSFKTGKKKKTLVQEAETDEEGKEIEPAQYEMADEVLSPLDLIMSRAGDLVFQKFMGKLGGDARKRGAVQADIVAALGDSSSPLGSLLGSINPRLLERALKDGDYVPIILEQLGPLAKQFLEKKINAAPSPGSGFGQNMM